MGGIKEAGRVAKNPGKSAGTALDSKMKKRKASLVESPSESSGIPLQQSAMKSKPGKLQKRGATGSGSAGKSGSMPMERAHKMGAKQQPLNKKLKTNKVNTDWRAMV